MNAGQSKVGKTQGRGSTRKERALPVKDAEAPATGLEEKPQQTLMIGVCSPRSM